MGYVRREVEVSVKNKAVTRSVWTCEECRAQEEGYYYDSWVGAATPEEARIWHDALCTSRGEPVRTEQDKAKVLTQLFERGQKILGISPEEAQRAFRKLMKWRMQAPPPRGFKSSDFYSEGDEKAPFFTEAYLYSLVGKEDARTILALLGAVGKAIGVSDRDLP